MALFAHLPATFVTLALAASSGAGFASQTPMEEIISLKQITIRVPAEASKAEQKARVDAFRVATRSIGSCADADAIARKLGGTVIDRPQMRLAALPPQVRLLLASAGPDRATVPFGKAPEVRVLVQCGAARKVPSRERPSA